MITKSAVLYASSASVVAVRLRCRSSCSAMNFSRYSSWMGLCHLLIFSTFSGTISTAMTSLCWLNRTANDNPTYPVPATVFSCRHLFYVPTTTGLLRYFRTERRITCLWKQPYLCLSPLRFIYSFNHRAASHHGRNRHHYNKCSRRCTHLTFFPAFHSGLCSIILFIPLSKVS